MHRARGTVADRPDPGKAEGPIRPEPKKGATNEDPARERETLTGERSPSKGEKTPGRREEARQGREKPRQKGGTPAREAEATNRGSAGRKQKNAEGPTQEDARDEKEEGRINERKNMAKQAITLKIAGKSYPFQIESGKEEMYRLAEREVNSYLTLIKQQNIRNWTDQDYLSMTALKFAIANVGMRQSRELDSEDLRRLEAIGEEIDSCLNDPTR